MLTTCCYFDADPPSKKAASRWFNLWIGFPADNRHSNGQWLCSSPRRSMSSLVWCSLSSTAVKGKRKLVKTFNFSFRNIDDVLSLNYARFGDYRHRFLRNDLEIKDIQTLPSLSHTLIFVSYIRQWRKASLKTIWLTWRLQLSIWEYVFNTADRARSFTLKTAEAGICCSSVEVITPEILWSTLKEVDSC